MVKTPVGDTEPFILFDIVRQGSVYGPQICIASMDKINILGKDIITHYGPTLQIQAALFVDDVTGVGGIYQINNTIYNCSLMEERKKMTFNNKLGKTEYMMIVGKFKEEERTVTKKVKKGAIERVKEHKMLGSWMDESGTYGINTKKRREKLPYMISTIKQRASPKNVGIYAIEARLKLAEIVIIPSILANAEGFPTYKNQEIKELESAQLNILTNILELPKSTPYCALLMEVGWWTMKARLEYRKLMLYHNIMNSDERRVSKQLLEVQENEIRETTWLAEVRKVIERLGITLNVKETLKSTWKREMKRKINEEMEIEIRQKCYNSKKSRIVKDDQYGRKEYLGGKVELMTVKKILRARMNMCRLPGNYKKDRDGNCPLCEQEEGSTEHYFRCQQVNLLAKAWDVKSDDLRSLKISDMRRVASFLEKVEIMLDP